MTTLSLYTYAQACRYLGVSDYLRKQLIDAGLLDPPRRIKGLPKRYHTHGQLIECRRRVAEATSPTALRIKPVILRAEERFV